MLPPERFLHTLHGKYHNLLTHDENGRRSGLNHETPAAPRSRAKATARLRNVGLGPPARKGLPRDPGRVCAFSVALAPSGVGRWRIRSSRSRGATTLSTLRAQEPPVAPNSAMRGGVVKRDPGSDGTL